MSEQPPKPPATLAAAQEEALKLGEEISKILNGHNAFSILMALYATLCETVRQTVESANNDPQKIAMLGVELIKLNSTVIDTLKDTALANRMK